VESRCCERYEQRHDGSDGIAVANAQTIIFYTNSDQTVFWNNVKRSNLVPEIGSGSDQEPSAYGQNPAKYFTLQPID
jgi:spore coat protein U-like protein